jgi:hypothetical protein
MENSDTAFIADAAVDAQAGTENGRAASALDLSGHDATVGARGGLEASSSAMIQSEETPLLAGGRRTSKNSGAGYQRDGIPDVDHLPWWKKPSVGALEAIFTIEYGC